MSGKNCDRCGYWVKIELPPVPPIVLQAAKRLRLWSEGPRISNDGGKTWMVGDQEIADMERVSLWAIAYVPGLREKGGV